MSIIHQKVRVVVWVTSICIVFLKMLYQYFL
jgi:hypothetical protein